MNRAGFHAYAEFGITNKPGGASAFGFSNFENYRIRALLYAGKPNWRVLDANVANQLSELEDTRGPDKRRWHIAGDSGTGSPDEGLSATPRARC